MLQDRLETAYNYMEEILRAGPNPALNRLKNDLFDHYYLRYGLLTPECMRVWDVSINLRLKNIQVPQKAVSNQIGAIRQIFSGFTTYPDIRFGQIRVGPSFQGAANVNQQAIVGMPDVNGQNIITYGQAHLNTVQNSDILPVAIFPFQNFWIAANNRGFTSHCAGGIRPLRLLPRMPEPAELNRLDEVEGVGTIPFFTRSPNIPHLPNPHHLPSLQMPITAGPNTWNVINVVNRPW